MFWNRKLKGIYAKMMNLKQKMITVNKKLKRRKKL